MAASWGLPPTSARREMQHARRARARPPPTPAPSSREARTIACHPFPGRLLENAQRELTSPPGPAACGTTTARKSAPRPKQRPLITPRRPDARRSRANTEEKFLFFEKNSAFVILAKAEFFWQGLLLQRSISEKKSRKEPSCCRQDGEQKAAVGRRVAARRRHAGRCRGLSMPEWCRDSAMCRMPGPPAPASHHDTRRWTHERAWRPQPGTCGRVKWVKGCSERGRVRLITRRDLRHPCCSSRNPAVLPHAPAELLLMKAWQRVALPSAPCAAGM